MQTEKVTFTKEKETLLITLYCRAEHSRSQNPVLRDPWAEEAVSRIDYDFSRFKSIRRALVISIRAKKFDVITAQFISAHPDAVVLHLGCGMDSRVFRVDPPNSVQWFDIDYPDVIELRRRLYPERAGYRMIGSPLSELSWLEKIPNNRPALIIAEGVMMYLPEEVVKTLLNRFVAYFPHGEVAFDTHSKKLKRWMTKRRSTVHKTGAVFKWGIEHPDDVRKLEPRLEFVKEFKTSELRGFPGITLRLRIFSRIIRMLPGMRRMLVPLVYRF